MLYNPDETMKDSLAPLKMFFTAAETIALEDTANHWRDCTTKIRDQEPH